MTNEQHQVTSFAPLQSNRHSLAQVLILGSAPSVKSLAEQEYYAHPQNAFWWIMGQLFGFDHRLPYAERQQNLVQQGVLVWDVLASCQRQGSLDSAIQGETEVPNDIPGLLQQHSHVSLVACNGGAAFKLLKKHHAALFEQHYDVVQMPSTSPAYASISKQEKLLQWSRVRALSSTSIEANIE